MAAVLDLPGQGDWTVDDLAELPPDLRYELVNGRLMARSSTPGHHDLAGEIWLAARANCSAEYLVSIDQSLRVDRRNEPRPDVVAVKIEHYGRTPVPVEDALLAVEVISEHSEFRDMVEKAEVYAQAGIRTYWIIDQKRDDISLTEMVLVPGRQPYAFGTHTTEVFSVTEPWPITIDLPALSARRMAILERIKPEPL